MHHTCAMNGVAVVCWLLCGCIIVVWYMCAMLHDMNDDDAGVVYCLDGKMCCDVVMVWGHTSFAGSKCRVLRHTTAAITAVGVCYVS